MLKTMPFAKKNKVDLSLWAQKIVFMTLKPMKQGQLILTTSRGEQFKFGDDPKAHQAYLYVHDSAFFTELILKGEIALGDTYVHGLWDSPDLKAVLDWFLMNIEQSVELTGSKRAGFNPLNLLKSTSRLAHQWRANSVKQARKNIQEHYDLSNDFYKLFLDPSMTYSSALFSKPDQPLEQAQQEKIHRLCQKLELKSTDHLLEIGSGWGSTALYAAKTFGCRVTTITLSEQQYAYVKNLIDVHQLKDQIDIQLIDYRQMSGQFDKIVSVEMIEAVGAEYLPTYFSKLHQLLKPKGIIAIQAITFPHARYDEYKKSVDWIQKEIFPGGHLPSVPVICEGLAQSGEFELRDLYDLGLHYARTLHLWHEAFHSRLAELKKIGFNETFIRKWSYYLKYCEAGFSSRNISAVQLVFARPNTAWG